MRRPPTVHVIETYNPYPLLLLPNTKSFSITKLLGHVLATLIRGRALTLNPEDRINKNLKAENTVWMRQENM